MVTDQVILRHIERQPHGSAGYKQLIREMGLRGTERQQLSERLKALVDSGRLIETGRDRYTLAQHAAAHTNLMAGRLTMHRDGYGFVIPNPHQRSPISGDIYINPGAIGSAMHGDQVLVELARKRDDGRAEGRILRVLTRANPTVVGTFHYGSRSNYVTPIDEKVSQDVIIPGGMEWPSHHDSEVARAVAHVRRERADSRAERVAQRKRPSDPDRVLGKEARRRTWDDLEGLIVDVEIIEWPKVTAENPRGRVVEILGYEDDFGVDVEIIIRKHHLPHRFPVEVLQDAQQFEAVIPAPELRHRRDYRSLPIVTIDGETARDFDDAVTVRRLSSGNFELQVHIADVAHYVTEDSPIDLEARLRGTSVYFPDRAIPMLPMELSTDLCSLVPHLDRLVLSCVVEIDHQGEIVGYTLNEGAIRSAERMTYTDVNLILERDPGLRQHYHAYVDVFELMRELAMVLNRKRMRRGSIDFDLPEPVIEFDKNGLMKGVTRSERNIAHRLIEEFMLAANECVAGYLERKHVASLYRIHEKPDPKRVYEFEAIAATFGYSLGLGALPVKRIQMKSDRRERYGTGQRGKTIELPEEVHITPRMYQKLTQKIAGKSEERILSHLMLRSLKQARYSAENEGHFALAAPTYTHFTSPIRRYPDLIVHRILKAVLRDSAESADGKIAVGVGTSVHSEMPLPWSKREPIAVHKKGAEPQRRAPLAGPIPELVLQEIADESSQSERRADESERELMEWKKAKFMEQHIGDDFDDLIVSVTKFGLFVELNDLFIEGLVPIATLFDDRYVLHENTRQIIGQRTRKTFSIGERVRVFLDRIDHMQKRLQFGIIQEESCKPPKRKRGQRALPD